MKTSKVAASLAVVMLGGVVAACGNGGTSPGSSSEQGGGNDSKASFTWLVYDRPEGRFQEDWEILKILQEKTNTELKFEVTSQEGLAEKRQIMIATNSVTDFIQVSNQEGREHGPDGIFLNLKDYLDIAPNLKKFYETYPEAEAMATGSDGGLYTVPILEGDPEGKGFNFVWMARQDLIDEHNLQPPTTLDEFYEFLKALKELYPDTYPLTSNSPVGDVGLYTVFGRAFTGIQGFFNLDPETDEYAFAPYHDGYRDALEYMYKLYEEKLLDPEYALITGPQWEERMLTGKSLVTYFWKADIDPMIGKAIEAGAPASYDLDAIPMFAADGIKPYQFSRNQVGATGRAISGKVKDKEAAVKLLDFMVGEEGTNLLSLGILDKTYTIVDGQPRYLEEFGTAPYAPLRKDFGVWYDNITMNNAVSRAAWEAGLDEKSLDINKRYEPFIIPAPKAIVKTDEELELEKSKLTNLNKYLEQKITEFVTGRTPINDATYQEFIDQARTMGADELLDMYNTSYKRTYGS
ncbi:extracellular solute-binding protein [Paenibacillus senegalensis]|uniref:extracellular solute-binding protein n=1 Tax=Paenibacillus senegalensis TaxID=1465766 RepID=UPI00028A3FDE|nr:extracellular solute-binding protein [Paenibacillus senegalensis]